MDSDKTVLPQDALLENAEKYLKFFSTNDAGEPTLAASIIRSFVEREHKEQPKDTSSDLRERILDEIEDPADCEHGHPSCAKCLYERREGLLREAADSLNRTEQANSDVLRAALKDKDDEIVRLEDMLSSRRDVTMERCDKCHRLYPIVDMVKYGDPDDVDAWHYLCAPCDYAEVKTHG